MITENDIPSAIGLNAIDKDGHQIGTVSQVYLDDHSGRPEWATVTTGLFGTKETFIPLAEAELTGDSLRVPYDKAKVTDAPRIDAEGHLSPDEESELYRHYGISEGTNHIRGTNTTTEYIPGQDSTTGTADLVGSDTSVPNTDDAMTRSEEQLRVGTESTQVGRARLRKHIVTENVTRTVPVSHEEVRIEREPITDANRGDALDGPALSAEEHEVTLHAERPVVAKETVPVERVRLDTVTVTDQQTVNAEVAHEEIEQVEGDVSPTDRNGH